MENNTGDAAYDVDYAGEWSMLKQIALRVLTELSRPRDVD